MRVLICPDKFAGTISAVAAASAVADGWRTVAPGDVLTERPLADGGPGFLDVLATAIGGQQIPVHTTDPRGRSVPGEVLHDNTVAYVESAHACGLHLLASHERDPKTTTSYGLGLLLAAAAETGAREIVVGLGGSAVNDAGAGMLAALGAPALDATGYALPYGAAALPAAVELGGLPVLRQVSLVAATDVDNPLLGPRGASSVFAAQKGADRHDVPLLEAAVERFAQVLERDLPGCPGGLGHIPGGGAAGGLGAALLAMGGRVESGIGLVRRLTGLDELLDAADLVVTGEGSFDQQSLHGKVVAGVASAAQQRGLPCVVLAGRVAVGQAAAAAAGITEMHELVAHFGNVHEAMKRPNVGLHAFGAQLARTWSDQIARSP